MKDFFHENAPWQCILFLLLSMSHKTTTCIGLYFSDFVELVMLIW
jgi:hypothetical protein